MRDADRQTRSRLMQLFEQQGLHPRHDLGQNFLVDLNLHDLIVRHAKLTSADVVLEVGTGTGGLTAHLAAHAGHVVTAEYDPHVLGHARALLAYRDNVTFIAGDALANKNTLAPAIVEAVNDALKAGREHEQREYGTPSDSIEPSTSEKDNPWQMQPAAVTLKLVANLPYHVATPVISNLIALDWPWSRMVVTVQYELAERVLAGPGTSQYSALSIWLQAQSRMELVRKLPPTVFWPQPKVDSAILKLERWPEQEAKIVNRAFFHDLVRDVFTQRRKQILGVLAQLHSGKVVKGQDDAGARPTLSRQELTRVLQSANIPPTSRPEQLTVEQYIDLCNHLQAMEPVATAGATTPPTPGEHH